jgi:2-keto-myo-inositol isomerase
VVERTGLGRIVLDTFHFWRGGGEPEDLARIPSDRIALVHLNDVNDVPRDSAQDSDRTFPGEGIMPVKEMCRALVHNGYGGPFSIEIFGEAQQQDPDEVCRHAFGAASELLAGV